MPIMFHFIYPTALETNGRGCIVVKVGTICEVPNLVDWPRLVRIAKTMHFN